MPLVSELRRGKPLIKSKYSGPISVPIDTALYIYDRHIPTVVHIDLPCFFFFFLGWGMNSMYVAYTSKHSNMSDINGHLGFFFLTIINSAAVSILGYISVIFSFISIEWITSHVISR